MSVPALASALVAKNMAQVQMAVAAKIAKQNAANAQSVATLVQAAQENINAIVSAPAPGTGQNIDISV